METSVTTPRKWTIPEYVLLGIILVAVIAGIWFGLSTRGTINARLAAADEEKRPSKITIVKITTPSCVDCFALDPLLATLKSQAVTVESERDVPYDSEEGRKLVADHGIKRAPAYIAIGEVSREPVKGFFEANGEIHGDTFVFTKTAPLYIDVATGKEHGRITAIVLVDPARCADCSDPLPLIDQLKRGGVALADEKIVNVGSAAGRAIIAQYRITKYPTFVITGDVDAYDLFKETRLGSKEKDGAFVLREVAPPFFDVTKGRIAGKVHMIMLTDTSCAECYDVKLHEGILANTFGVRFVSKRTVDIASAEGRQLKSLYALLKVPTILLSGDVSTYAGLQQAWAGVGSVEKSGWYVFRNLDVIPGIAYKDLEKKTVVKTEQQ